MRSALAGSDLAASLAVPRKPMPRAISMQRLAAAALEQVTDQVDRAVALAAVITGNVSYFIFDTRALASTFVEPQGTVRLPIFLVGPAHDNPERIIPQRSLQCLRLIPRPRIHTSRSSSVVRITGIAFGWIGSTTAFGNVVRCGTRQIIYGAMGKAGWRCSPDRSNRA
jgi:hypothetical protein